MNTINDGGPAFPVWELNGKGQPEMTGFGMTLRTYAAIHLAVPQSEHEWIDDMIRERQRDELAKAMMQEMGWGGHPNSQCVEACYVIADAMLAARENKA